MDKFCQLNSILGQVIHHPRGYNWEMMARQIGLHMIKIPKKFYPLVQDDLTRSGENSESFCVNIFDGNRGLDDILSIVTVDMWQISISIISMTDVVNLFHEQSKPDVVLIVNGGCASEKKRGLTHYSGTVNKEMMARQIGLHMIKNPKKFYPLVQDDLTRSGESSESFCINIFDGNRGLDDIHSIVTVDMWQISISIFSMTDVVNLFHEQT